MATTSPSPVRNLAGHVRVRNLVLTTGNFVANHSSPRGVVNIFIEFMFTFSSSVILRFTRSYGDTDTDVIVEEDCQLSIIYEESENHARGEGEHDSMNILTTPLGRGMISNEITGCKYEILTRTWTC